MECPVSVQRVQEIVNRTNAEKQVSGFRVQGIGNYQQTKLNPYTQVPNRCAVASGEEEVARSRLLLAFLWPDRRQGDNTD